MNQTKNKITVIFPKTRPSHIARLRAIAAKSAYTITGIEIVASDKTSCWGGLKNLGEFNCYTLFYGNAQNKINGASIWKKLQEKLDLISPQVLAIAGWYHPSALACLNWASSRGVPSVLMSETTEDDYNRRIWKEAIKRRIIRTFPTALVGGTPQSQYLQKKCIGEYLKKSKEP